MGDFSKSGDGTSHGNTAVILKVKIYFQVFPGIGGWDIQRGIPGVPFEVEMIDSSGIGLKSTGKTAKDGGIDLNIPVGEKVILTIFETDYLISIEDSIKELHTLEGCQQRLSLLGYFVESIEEAAGEKTDLPVINFQADNDLNAEGWNYSSDEVKDKLKILFGE